MMKGMNDDEKTVLTFGIVMLWTRVGFNIVMCCCCQCACCFVMCLAKKAGSMKGGYEEFKKKAIEKGWMPDEGCNNKN